MKTYELPSIESLIEDGMRCRAMQIIPANCQRDAALLYAAGHLAGFMYGLNAIRQSVCTVAETQP